MHFYLPAGVAPGFALQGGQAPYGGGAITGIPDKGDEFPKDKEGKIFENFLVSLKKKMKIWKKLDFYGRKIWKIEVFIEDPALPMSKIKHIPRGD